MKHATLGMGAIGGLVGTALASIGEDVTAVVRLEGLANFPDKLTLERPQGSISAAARAAASVAQPVDVLWIATKTYQLQIALQAVHSMPTCTVPLLNGVDHIQVLRDRFGHDGVVPAAIAVEAEKIAPGRFLQRSPLVRLNLAATAEPLLAGVVERLSGLGFTCQFIQNEQTLLWSKLSFLAPFALVTSASGMNKQEILADPKWKTCLEAAFAEAGGVAAACGAKVDQQRLRTIFDTMPSDMRSSMQKDLAAGRQLELDAIAGPILRGGEQYGVDTSTTARLVAAMHERSAVHHS